MIGYSGHPSVYIRLFQYLLKVVKYGNKPLCLREMFDHFKTIHQLNGEYNSIVIASIFYGINGNNTCFT